MDGFAVAPEHTRDHTAWLLKSFGAGAHSYELTIMQTKKSLPTFILPVMLLTS
jgi:hypothetical protein